MKKSWTLVIGVGNPYRGDDGVGIYIAEKIDAYKVPGLSIEVQSGEGATLIDCWQSHDRVYLIDAAAPNGSPGQIHRIETHKESIRTGLFHSSTHAFGVLEAIELARVLGKLPEELILYGIEGGCFKEGVKLTDEIETAAEDVIAQILREVSRGCSGWAHTTFEALYLDIDKEATMPATKVKEYLDSQKVEYTTLKHSPVYTAQETAASAHIPGHQLVKSVMIKLDGEMAMIVLPAAYRVNFDRLKKALGASQVELATEKEFKDFFPDCELGAMPPFGNLYGMEVIADESLSDEVVIAFCAGSHTELIQLSSADFEELAKPKVLDISLKS